MRKYNEIKASEVLETIRFDVPPQNQGQIIEVAYGDNVRYRSPAVAGAPFKRVLDRSDNSITYYALAAKRG